MPQRIVVIARFVALAMCAVLAAGACSGSDGDVAAPSASVSVSPTVSAPTAEIPVVPVPKRPPDEHTSDGAIAFAKYAIDVVNRMYLTGDTASLMAISTPDCPTCLRAKKDVDAVLARGNVYRGGEITLVEAGYVVIADDVIPTVPATVDSAALEEVTPSGVVVKTWPAEKGQQELWDLKWEDGRWLFADLRVAPE